LAALVNAGLSLVLVGCGRAADPPTDARTKVPPSSSKVAAPLPAQPAQVETRLAPTNDQPFQLTQYEIRIDPKELRALERNPDSDETHPATFIAHGLIYTNVQIRFRGEWARSWPKKPFKIFFSRSQPFQGHHSLNLNSAWRDPAYVRETLAYHVYQSCGVPASRSRLVHLRLNGQFRGIYVEVEQVDKTLLSHFGLKGAGLFKATSDNNQADERDHGRESAFAAHYENETSKTNGLGELRTFCHELATATNAADFFSRRMDVEKYINYLAATVLIQHWDGFNKNHFMVYDRRGSGKWLAWPWDLDRTFGDHWNGSFTYADLPILLGTRQRPAVTGWNRLQDRFFSDPALRGRFYKRLLELLETEFTEKKLFPMLEQWEAELAVVAGQDRRRWPGPSEDVHEAMADLKKFIERRRSYLLREARKAIASNSEARTP
jgi:spore coat protein H